MIIWGNYFEIKTLVLIIIGFLFLLYANLELDKGRGLANTLIFFGNTLLFVFLFGRMSEFNRYKKEYFKNLQIEKNLSDEELIKEYENTDMNKLFEKYKMKKELENIRGE